MGRDGWVLTKMDYNGKTKSKTPREGAGGVK